MTDIELKYNHIDDDFVKLIYLHKNDEVITTADITNVNKITNNKTVFDYIRQYNGDLTLLGLCLPFVRDVAVINHPDEKGNTLLHEVTMSLELGYLKRLVENIVDKKNINFNTRNRNGYTALMQAVVFHKFNHLVYLSKHSDINITTYNGADLINLAILSAEPGDILPFYTWQANMQNIYHITKYLITIGVKISSQLVNNQTLLDNITTRAGPLDYHIIMLLQDSGYKYTDNVVKLFVDKYINYFHKTDVAAEQNKIYADLNKYITDNNLFKLLPREFEKIPLVIQGDLYMLATILANQFLNEIKLTPHQYDKKHKHIYIFILFNL
ncbi:MAG: hypothetical protein Faunusvirus5_22 [Faunusvirus sp.]|uniref:Ankyrin repeat protein n=1 Tax=Faunusvirus sp. TaxID=2487766 RepID=A0A3G5A049_9VIRU|nr:MAG: hypothetical protein Faunusvirus5_22 [Faunusvirus sp.]